MKSTATKQNGPTWRAVSDCVEAGRVIVGIDEVGRGAWAGPVVAAAVVLPHGLMIDGLGDSKVVTPRRRRLINRVIRRHAEGVGVGWVSAAEVDEHGLSWAVRESGLRALESLSVQDPVIILDGTQNYLEDTHGSIAIVKADALVVPVAAASIVAKVARDQYMCALASRHPDYSFEKHKGYGTATHQRALAELGPSVQHRLSYAPLKALK